MAVITVKVVPRAASDEIVGWRQGALKVRIKAPPADGRANRALESLLAEALGLRKSAVAIVAGHGSALKRVEITGLLEGEVLSRLGGE